MEEISGLERLLALEDIKMLKARRDRAVDTKDWGMLEALHAPDHTSYNDDYPQWTTAAEMIANDRCSARLCVGEYLLDALRFSDRI